jgi:hypothetical protein
MSLRSVRSDGGQTVWERRTCNDCQKPILVNITSGQVAICDECWAEWLAAKEGGRR